MSRVLEDRAHRERSATSAPAEGASRSAPSSRRMARFSGGERRELRPLTLAQTKRWKNPRHAERSAKQKAPQVLRLAGPRCNGGVIRGLDNAGSLEILVMLSPSARHAELDRP